MICFIRRSTSESKEIAKLFMVSMRMKKALHKLASERKIDMRSYKITIDKTIDGFCEELTNELKVCRNIKCDSEAKYRTIEGCCNNLKNSDLGNFYDILDVLKTIFVSELLTLLGTGGCSTPPYRKSALRPSKWPPNDPKFRDFSYFYMTYLKSKKKIFGFSQ